MKTEIATTFSDDGKAVAWFRVNGKLAATALLSVELGGRIVIEVCTRDDVQVDTFQS